MSFWTNFDELPRDKVIVHRMLSDSHRRAAVSFAFYYFYIKYFQSLPFVFDS